ncbi:phage major capsid protein [Mycetocola reblochoni]|uniref:Phage major capsid protein n=1 Tax=Mycetocola reblochoni TaxID=331618 RepID=A0A3L6ZSM9_9MICO|nr:phage major capsid protein [Mycetocola reblochoni]RLP70874.1 phage major capsid protein [Mycetocola reblochoni]
MAVFGSGDLKNLPRSIADGIVRDVQTASTVAALSGREAMRFGNTDIITFNDVPRAEFVGEGAEKGSTTGAFGFVTAKPRKAQVTMRFNQEVQWADQDYQLGVLNELSAAARTALARALDLGVYHRINPIDGAAIKSFTEYVNGTTLRVEASDTPDLDLEAAGGLLIGNQKNINGIAIDPSYAWKISTARYSDGRKKFPELGLGINVSSFEGIAASVGNTVSGQPEAADTRVKAIVGDFQSGIRWGVQRELPLELIQFGDPDGQGDLKRQNQIALRLEILYGWYVFQDRFAVIKAGA